MNRLIETDKMKASINGYFHGILETVGMTIDAVDTNAELNTLVDMVAAAGSYPVDAVPVVRRCECMHRRQPDGFCPVVGGFCGDENWFCACGIKE